MTWQPPEEFADGLFPPEMLAEREREQKVYLVVQVPVYGTDEHVDKLVKSVERDLEIKVGSKVTITRVKPDGSTIVLPD